VVSTLEGLPAAVESAGLGPPALFVIGPTVGHAERLDWHARLPLAGERIALPAAHEAVARALDEAGADVIAVPLPITPVGRVVMGAALLTGCVMASTEDIEQFDEARSGPGWSGRVVAWCLGPEAAQRARDRGWRWVEELAADTDGAALVERVKDHQRSGRR
jgi:hypothetical protein